jgi:multiple sugar transport system substrate-binding protein
MSKKDLSRRKMLKLMGLATAATVAPAFSSSPIARAASRVGGRGLKFAAQQAATLTVMLPGNELSADEIKAFEDANPGFKINRIDPDQTRFFAMIAGGNAPDIVRTQAPGVPQLIARKLMLDLTPYFAKSAVLKADDLAPANDVYKAEGPLAIGKGKIYGMVKDWSPDMTIWVNTKAFDEAGIKAPTSGQPMTYKDYAEIARKTTKTEGQRTLRHGALFEYGWLDRIWMVMLAEKGASLFTEDQTKIKLVGNDETIAVIKWFFDLQKDGAIASPLHPLSASWNGEAFVKGQAATLQYGYWFTPMAGGEKDNLAAGAAVMLPAPTWAGKPIDSTITATGGFIPAASKNQDGAWKFYEYYFGGAPALARARGGWGVPALKSLFKEMPNKTPFEQATRKVLDEEMKKNIVIQFNPYLLNFEPTVVADTYGKNVEAALSNDMSFDDFLKKIEDDTNKALQDGKDSIGALS